MYRHQLIIIYAAREFAMPFVPRLTRRHELEESLNFYSRSDIYRYLVDRDVLRDDLKLFEIKRLKRL